MRESRGRTGGLDTPALENHKAIGFLGNTCPNPLENHKATKPAFNVGTSSTRQLNASLMAFRWRGYDGPLLVVFGSSLRSSTKTKVVRVGPFCIRAC